MTIELTYETQDYEIHPIATIFPDMSDGDYARLKTSIQEQGQLEPIWILDGAILDGRHRYRACRELGIEPRIREYTSGDDMQSLSDFVIALNKDRRHLTASQLAAVAVDLEKVFAKDAKERMSIGGKSHDGTGQPIEGVPKMAPLHNGKARDHAAKQVGVSHGYVSAAKKLSEEAPDLFNDVRTGKTKLSKAKKEYKRRKQLEKREQAPQIVDDRILVGDLRELGQSVADNSVDLIFTDPPYGYDHVTDYEALAELGARVLKPGGSLLCYCGQTTVPDVLSVMLPHLRYHWIISMVHQGGSQRFMGIHNVLIGWKPILWFTKGNRRDQTMITDTIKGEPGKDHHDWEQGVGEARYFIDNLTIAGELVLDPFCGSGTTCIAAKSLDRTYLAFEIDPHTAQDAIVRVNDGR